MSEETIGQIEERIRKSTSITEERRLELLELLASLKSEVGHVAKSNRDAATSIASHADRSTVAATKDEPDEAELRASLDNLASSVQDFEESHPKLVQVVNRICVTLSSLGI